MGKFMDWMKDSSAAGEVIQIAKYLKKQGWIAIPSDANEKPHFVTFGPKDYDYLTFHLIQDSIGHYTVYYSDGAEFGETGWGIEVAKIDADKNDSYTEIAKEVMGLDYEKIEQYFLGDDDVIVDIEDDDE